MHPANLLTAMNNIAKKCIDYGIDPDTVEVTTFKGHGGLNVVRARAWVGEVLLTMDQYV